ncbi:uncharacterized protein M421DRAFT_419017 [Didymella exigua CBS 183.55]|uniref:Uncharacterized protein n=1 Tax=Didymella exigua CBS 183.55 TaxID=1150837 RepID=A0A6A5RRB0_9PLEO|nr:uncharacterized protein M421DRAFT_419017 [Didymella exigua CBS 183.55]KAF1929983.1 hypothetical protein M421DRAFT_419017 [Didymella exigua CBS 183.55]
MSYAPFGEERASPYAENIEPVTKHDGRTICSYAPPQGSPRDKMYNDPKAYSPPGKTVVGNWPVQSQQVAVLIPLRATTLVFDFLLASSPLIFLVLALKVTRLDGNVPNTANNRLQEMLQMVNHMNTMTSVDTIDVTSLTRGATIMEEWMFDPVNFIGVCMYDMVNLYELPAEIFAEQLTILWNSFFQSTYATRALSGNLDEATSTNITSNSEDIDPVAFKPTKSLVSQRRDAYCVN